MTDVLVTDDQKLLAIQPAAMEQAYLEYRRACYHSLYRHSRERGLIECLSVPKTISEISAEMGFSPKQYTTLELLLRALVQYGAVARNGDDSQAAYSVISKIDDAELEEQIDPGLVERATGAGSLQDLLHGNSYPGIIDSLFEDDNKVAAAFIEKNLAIWDEFLSTPFYRYNRVRAADRITKPGARVADIACGPGFGLRECAGWVTETGIVHGIEISADFAAAAIRRNPDLDNIQVTRANVDGDGLAFLADNILDGAMMVGAFHFLEDQRTFLTHIRRVLKAGAPLALSYVFMKGDSYDQQLTDLRFHMRIPQAHPKTEHEVIQLATSCGFIPESSYTMGCYQSFVLLADRG